MPELSVCVVNWNTRELLDACLSSLAETAAGIVLEVIVVDNASWDGSAGMVRERHPNVILLENDDNVGYAAANNQALTTARASFKLLLNADIVIHPGALQELLQFAREHPRVGAVAPRLVYPDGTLQRSCRSFPTPDVVIYEALGLSRLFPCSRRFGKYRMTWWDYGEARPVDQPMASALLLRQEALDEVGLFDGQFPIFFNDVDLCSRLWETGWEVWYDPQATMTHHEGASTSQVRREMIAESHRSFLRYYRKHYRGRVNLLAYWTAVTILTIGRWIRGGRPAREGLASNDSEQAERTPEVGLGEEATMIDASLLEILVCPDCKADVELDAEQKQIVCTGCGKRYPIRDGIPIMLIEEATTPDEAD